MKLGVGPLVLVVVVAVALVAVPLAAAAQQAGKAHRIGVLATGSLAESALSALRQGLRDQGYVEQQNLIIERRDSEDLQRLPDLAAELVRLKVDVLVTSGAPAARAAKGATSTIPVVMAQINDPVSLGLVASLAKPGGNMTGLANLHSELAGKQMELLREAVPAASRVAVLWNPGNPGAEMIVKHSERVSRGVGVTLHPTAVRDRRELDSAFAAMSRARVDAMFLPPDPFFLPLGGQIIALAARHRLPTIYGWRELVQAGGLIAYGPDIPDLFRRAAIYVDKILRGATPAALPIEQPTRFELMINLKTAKALGLTIPPSLLLRADQVIE